MWRTEQEQKPWDGQAHQPRPQVLEQAISLAPGQAGRLTSLRARLSWDGLLLVLGLALG